MEDLLKEVKSKHYFWVHNGMIIKSIEELFIALELMNNSTFKFHVTKYKNDFSKWVRDVIKDEGLAKNLLKTQDKHASAIKVIKRVKELKDNQKGFFFKYPIKEFILGILTGLLIGFLMLLVT